MTLPLKRTYRPMEAQVATQPAEGLEGRCKSKWDGFRPAARQRTTPFTLPALPGDSQFVENIPLNRTCDIVDRSLLGELLDFYAARHSLEASSRRNLTFDPQHGC